MNNIYKVIWSKAKNCYVVASEIARSHTKSATGSEKIGGVTRRSLLASLMALSLLCGGLGVASAANGTVHVAESAAGTAEVYTTEKVDTLLKDYGKKTDVEDNKNNIAALRTTTTDQGQKITENATQIANNTDAIDKKIDTETANERFAAKVDLTALQNQVTGKVDENTFEDALEDKADRTYVDTEVGKKANKETTLTGYGITDAYTKDATDTAITTKVNEEKDARELKDTELSGRIDTLSTTVNSKVSKTDLNTTLGNYYTQAETNAAIKTAVDDEKNARENAINGEVTSRNKAIADAIALEETNRDAAITKEETKRKEEDAKLEGKITENTTAINNEKAVREAADTDLSKRIGTVTEDGKYIKKSGTNNVSENLKVLDTQAKINADNIQTNANNVKTNKDEIARVNGELVKTNDYFNKELGKTNDHFNTELGNTNAALQATNKRTAGIERTGTGVAADNQTVIEGNVRFDQNGNVSGVKDLQTDTIHATGEITSGGLDAKAGDIKTTGKVSAGDISTGTLETTGNATIGGNLDVTGTLNIKDVTAETINISKSENNPDYKSEGSIIGEGGKLSVSNEKFDKRNNITEKSELNVNEKGTVNWATSTDATGNVTEGRSEVTADNIKNSVKKTEGGKTFGYEENITETGKVGTATDKEGNTSSTRQDSKGVYGYAKGQDGNKSYTKQEGNRIAESVIGQDGKQTKSEMTSTDITNTAKDGTITNDAKDIVNKASGNISNSSATMDTTVTGKATESYGELETEVKGNEKHTVKGDQINEVDGKQINTIKNGQENIISGGQTNTITGGQVNNITGDQTTTITGNKKETVEGKVTENFKGGQETNVTGNQDIHVTGKQTNKIDGDQENTIGGNQTTTVTGDISNKAKNITNEASNSITDKVGDHTRVLDSDGITDTVGGSTFKQRIDKIMMESKNVSIKAEETLTNEAKVITNKASEVINNEAVNINNTATGIITSKASEIKNQTDKLISNKVGENTWENMENGKITTSIKDGAKQNLTQSDAVGTTQSTVDGVKSTVTIQNADGLADAVTDGTNTSVQNQTASAIAAAVKDGEGNENASVANATTSVNTIKSGSKANTVISTADGTSFINSEAAAPVGDGTEVKTTIKGNTITTGKVTMDYAEVMKDLGVRGNANITGKTTTGSLEVKGESKLTGDVTMESNATVKKDLTVEGNTNLKNTKVDGTLDVTQKANFGDSVSIAKDLSVGGNATIKGDVTASSYKVGDKTYISAAGINANDQKITNVADGSISEGSKDAVNGGQLYTVKNDFEGKVNKVGANAAAMANLHPMEFDPDSKWNIAAAIGNYGSETAAALGAFYRPNDDVMVNLSTAFGTGENMVGGGVSVRLGKGGNKLSREETNALKAQVADLTARMDALLSVLNPNMSKDFPDVPENHWAYEAVSRLAGNDIVQGYPDGEFHGERTMTRYEMAEIIYNALSRGAEAEKELVEEFKPELQAMAASEKATAEKAEG